MEGGAEHVAVMIVGAGPAGLATAACLNRLSIPNILVEREDCCASLWKKRAYDRLKLHLGKEFCNLPHLPFPPDAPRFVPRLGFVNYLDNYASHFEINPRYHCSVQSASYDATIEKWRVEVLNTSNNVVEVFIARFLVVATGENSKGVIPNVAGLETFQGKYMHSNEYENGKSFEGKDVLVVGCGNSGMEISYDLSNYGAKTSIVVRSPVHVLTTDITYFGMRMLKFLPVELVDKMVVGMSKIKYGDTSAYGIRRPEMGPFEKKYKTGRTPTIDVGALDKIVNGEIRVFPSMISKIEGSVVEFDDGKSDSFDAIIFATGYSSMVQKWLKGDLFNENGFPKTDYPNHWKGENGIYCAGFSKRGLAGISEDAQHIANHIAAYSVDSRSIGNF